MPRSMTALLATCLGFALLSCRAGSGDVPAASTPGPPPTATAPATPVPQTLTAENEGRYTPTIVTSGIPALDPTLLAFQRPSKADQLADRVVLLPMPCVNNAEEAGPPCGSFAPGAEVPAFFVETPRQTGYLVDMAAVRSAIAREIGGHAAWTIYAVSYPTADDPIVDGYVIGLRAATGNSGLLWYVAPDGGIVGVRFSVGYFNGAHPEITYICGPSYGRIACGG